MPTKKTDLQMKPIISSNLAAAGYDENGEKLKIRFKNGTEYEYNPVPKWMYDGIFTADSPGKFFREHITTSKTIGFKKVTK